MAQRITTIRLSDELRGRVDGLVEATGRPMNYHIQRAVEEYVARQAWQVGHIRRALEQARGGQGTLLDAYVERGVMDGTLTREGYERALAEELTDSESRAAGV